MIRKQDKSKLFYKIYNIIKKPNKNLKIENVIKMNFGSRKEGVTMTVRCIYFNFLTYTRNKMHLPLCIIILRIPRGSIQLILL